MWAIAAGLFSAAFFGEITLNLRLGASLALSAVGGAAAFVLVYRFDPASNFGDDLACRPAPVSDADHCKVPSDHNSSDVVVLTRYIDLNANLRNYEVAYPCIKPLFDFELVSDQTFVAYPAVALTQERKGEATEAISTLHRIERRLQDRRSPYDKPENVQQLAQALRIPISRCKTTAVCSLMMSVAQTAETRSIPPTPVVSTSGNSVRPSLPLKESFE